MDQNLGNATKPLRDDAVRNFRRHGTFLVVVVVLLTTSLSGCQTSPLAGGDMPIPPAVLKAEDLHTARLQSPDDTENRVRSLNRDFGDYGYEEQIQSPGSKTAGDIDRANIVADVVIKGNRKIPMHRLTQKIRTRPGRYFDPDKLQQDVDQLWRMPEINRVKGPYLSKTDNGVIITLEIVERSLISKVKFVGNRASRNVRSARRPG